MKIVFVDETDRQADATHRTFFCICGLIVDDSKVISLTAALETIKAKYGLANLKDCRKNGLDESTRIAITSEIFACLNDNGAKIIGVILGDFSLSAKLPKEDIYMGAISFLIERVVLSLIKEGGNGVVVFDSMEKSLEKELRKRFYDYVNTGVIQMTWKAEPEGAIKDHILSTLMFSDDDQSPLIQAVDLVAVSLNSAIANTYSPKKPIVVNDLPNANKFLKIYWPLFVRDSKGKVEGWGIKVWY